MTKRLLIFFLTLTVATSLMISCSGDGEGKETTGSGETVSTDDAGSTFPETDDATESTTAPETDIPGPNTETDDPVITQPPETTGESTDDVMADPEIITLNYIALGDSIAAGYGLADPETERYSAIIDGYIDLYEIYECESYNHGVNGQTSSELLEALKSGFAPELSGADFVTISIGANNVLGPAVKSLTQYSVNLLIDDAELRAANNAAIYGTFEKEVEAGIAQFESDLPGIIEEIYKIAPDAQVIFQTVYNPYNNVSLTLDFGIATLDMNEMADTLVTRLNKIINDNARTLGYDVADIYTAFESETDVVNAGASGSDSLISGLDPHPNAKGHTLIADTISAVIYID